jgi:predicted acylesterase/phospholipase RssA
MTNDSGKKQNYEAGQWYKSIGLALSGGGYRAAAFHLGALDYLEHIGLQDKICKISTVSGGTFTGVKYALSQVEGQTFPEFFSEYYYFLNNTDLLRLGLEKLAENRFGGKVERKDMITAMAQVYAETFLQKADGAPYLFGDILNSNIALGDTVFNATEFRHGLAFRFQRRTNPKAFIGNYKIRINKNDAAKIRMADIVAASSCFPGGFEPMAFPDDFVWPEGHVPETLRQQFVNGPIALMDGGVYDNQGLQSLLLADVRNSFDNEDLSMFIISDVDQQSADLYRYPKRDKNRKGLTLNTLAGLSIVFIVLLTISLSMLLINLFVQGFSWYNFFLFVLPAGLVAVATYALLWLRGRIVEELDKIPMIGRAAWKDIKHLSVDEIEDMISLRLGSLFAMAGSVFMKRVRGLVYGLVYGDFRAPINKILDEMYGLRRISNLIDHLKTGRKFNEELLRAGVPEPSAELQRITDIAANMKTTLWFDKPDQLQSLVASGQATLCYNLMKFIVRNFGEDPEQFPDDARVFWERLNEDWQTFNETPLSLVEKRLDEAL